MSRSSRFPCGPRCRASEFRPRRYINEFAAIKRDLVLAVDPSLYPQIAGQTDSEILFFLVLAFGLEDDPPAAIEHTVGLVEVVGPAHPARVLAR